MANNKRLDEESVKAEQNLDREIAKLIDQFLEGPVILPILGFTSNRLLHVGVHGALFALMCSISSCSAVKIKRANQQKTESTKTFTAYKSMFLVCF